MGAITAGETARFAGKAAAPVAAFTGASWGPPVFVWGVWAAMLLAALGFVAKYGSNEPHWDDWGFVTELMADEPVTLATLWAQNNEHRHPLQKLLWLAGVKWAGDFRAILVFNVLSLAALAFVLILASRNQRGWTAYRDAFFPIALVNLGHGQVFLWPNLITYTVPAFLTGLWLGIVVRRGCRLTLGSGMLAGACLLLLPLCGGMGLVLLPALATWLGYSSVLRWRSGSVQGKRDSLVFLALLLAAGLEVFLYFRGYESPVYANSPNELGVVGPAVVGKTTLEFLTIGFGPASAKFWPASGLGTAAVMALTVGCLGLAAWRPKRPEGHKALGLLFFLGAIFCMALVVGRLRPGAGLEMRYVTLAVPALCCAYFAWGLCGSPVVGEFSQMCLFTLVSLMLSSNTQEGLNYAGPLRRGMEAFERDLRDGLPPYVLIRRHGAAFIPAFLYEADLGGHSTLTCAFPLLRRAGLGPFRSLREDPPFREIKVPVEPAALDGVTWKGGTGKATGAAAHVDFYLGAPRYVCGVRINYSFPDDPGNPAWFRVSWRPVRGDGAGKEVRYLDWEQLPGPDGHKVMIWVADTIGGLRVYPDSGPRTFKVSEIVLFVPEAGPRASPGP
jgi:hypothetical protein